MFMSCDSSSFYEPCTKDYRVAVKYCIPVFHRLVSKVGDLACLQNVSYFKEPFAIDNYIISHLFAHSSSCTPFHICIIQVRYI